MYQAMMRMTLSSRSVAAVLLFGVVAVLVNLASCHVDDGVLATYLTSPPDGSDVACGCTSQCMMEVQGTVSRPLTGGEKLFVVVRPLDDATPRYFIQFGASFVNETSWTAWAQLGSSDFPARQDQRFEVRAIVVDTAIAGHPPVEALPNLTRNTLPGRIDVDEDVHVFTVTCNTNTPPTAQSQAVDVVQGMAQAIRLVAIDLDVPVQILTYSIVTPPANGAVSSLNTTTGQVTYAPNAGFIGPDSFTFKANDGLVDSNVGTVSITVFEHDKTLLESLATEKCWHLYSPYKATATSPVAEDRIRRELQMIYDAGGRGLVTYAMLDGVEKAPCIAKQIGFRWVLAGVYWWTNGVDNGQTDSTLEKEKAALDTGISCVDGIVIGNEGLVDSADWNQPRYTLADLDREVRAMKSKYPGKLVTTAEGTVSYEAHPSLVTDPNLTDFVFPNIHPWWGGFRDPVKAVQEVVRVLNTEPFSRRGDRLLVLHECWWPTGTDGQDEQDQETFFQELLKTCVPFCWGETINQPWKDGPEGSVGSHWGLWHYDESSDTYVPKQAVQVIRATGCTTTCR